MKTRTENHQTTTKGGILLKEGSNDLYLKTTLKEQQNLFLPSDTGRSPFNLGRILLANPAGINLPYLVELYTKHEGFKKRRQKKGFVPLPTPDNTIPAPTATLYLNDTALKRYRQRVSRAVDRLEAEGLVDLRKDSYNLIWITPKQELLNLILLVSNYARRKSVHKKGRLPKRTNPKRINSILNFMAVKPRDYPTWEGLKDTTGQALEKAVHNFGEYLNEAEEKCIILKEIDTGKLFTLPYRTRFTDLGVVYRAVKRYEGIWNKVDHYGYNQAVHLTLTSDPYRHENIYDCNRHFGRAFTDFQRALCREIGVNIPYIRVNEFTDTCLLHSHIVYFGRPYLLNSFQISDMWKNTGQGEIIDIYSLKKKADGWHYARSRPKDSPAGETAEIYLEKYLKKALGKVGEGEGMEPYWTWGTRFFTYSRALTPETVEPAPVSTGRYQILGTWNREEAESLCARAM